MRPGRHESGTRNALRIPVNVLISIFFCLSQLDFSGKVTHFIVKSK